MTWFFGLLLKIWRLVSEEMGRLAADKRAKQAAEEAKAKTIADEVENDIGTLTPEQRREALRKWSR